MPINEQTVKEVLIVEDSTDDFELTMEALKGTGAHYNLRLVQDGVEAMSYLRQEGRYAHMPRPDLVVLDLKLPRKNGHEVLAEIKNDPHFMKIPVLILTTSHDQRDVEKAYQNHANCYVTKPSDLPQLLNMARWIEQWITTVHLPKD